jgi:hypothetical protein
MSVCANERARRLPWPASPKQKGQKQGWDARGVLGDFQEGANISLNVARRTRASGTTSRIRRSSSHAKARTRATGTHSPSGGMPRSAGSARHRPGRSLLIRIVLSQCTIRSGTAAARWMVWDARNIHTVSARTLTKAMPAYPSDASSEPGDHEVNIRRRCRPPDVLCEYALAEVDS